MAPRLVSLLAVVVCACGGSSTSQDPASPSTADGWSNVEKCEHVCAAYCGVRERCDGTPHEVCREALDEADGGTCAERAALFDEVEQPQVERCITAIQGMSCAAFERMFNTGEGVPAECDGILR